MIKTFLGEVKGTGSSWLKVAELAHSCYRRTGVKLVSVARDTHVDTRKAEGRLLFDGKTHGKAVNDSSLQVGHGRCGWCGGLLFYSDRSTLRWWRGMGMNPAASQLATCVRSAGHLRRAQGAHGRACVHHHAAAGIHGGELLLHGAAQARRPRRCVCSNPPRVNHSLTPGADGAVTAPPSLSREPESGLNESRSGARAVRVSS
jgi:hypothetical protein